MSKGKQKGFKKEKITIQDEAIAPYYIVDEDRQYILMKKGTISPCGYYTSLGNALKSAAKEINRVKNSSEKVSLSDYLNRYEEVNTQILKAIKL
jgi:Uri superfamily endonuclease